MTKALGIVFSARTGGNLRDIADRLFGRIGDIAPEVETQIIETAHCSINPCHGCQYECFLGDQPSCPIVDDVLYLWRLASASDLLVYFLPTYGGMPPAAWLAFHQRYHGARRSLPDKAPAAGKIAVVSIFEPLGTRLGDLSQNIIVRHLAGEDRTLVGYEPIIPSNHGLKALRDRLIAHSGIQSRVDDLGTRAARALLQDTP